MNGPATAFSKPVEPPPAGAPWTVLHLVRWSTAYLEGKGVEGPRLDVEHLLAHVLDVDRLQLYLRFEQPVTSEELARFRPLLLERVRRKPLQYILGRSSFRGVELAVDPRVLIPRPETEELVEAVLERVRGWDRRDLHALDVGTGSGAIALALALEGPFASVVATDASPDALRVAGANVRELDLEDRVECREGAGFATVRAGERFHVVVSNPPYVAEDDFPRLQPEIREWEPREALVAGDGGLSVLRELVDGASGVLEDGGLLALEVGAGQAAEVAERIRTTPGFDPPAVVRDLAGVERIVLGTWKGE